MRGDDLALLQPGRQLFIAELRILHAHLDGPGPQIAPARINRLRQQTSSQVSVPLGTSCLHN